MQTHAPEGNDDLEHSAHSRSRILSNSVTLLLALVVFGLALVLSTARPSVAFHRTYLPLYSFGSDSAAPGGSPGRLVAGSDGALYGTSTTGGDSIFRFEPGQSQMEILYSFPGTTGLGGCLASGRNGALLGTTASGGSAGRGTVFTLKEDGTGFAVVHSFGREASEGLVPLGSLVVAEDGTLFGTTYSGGDFKRGVLFRMAPDGAGYSVLHHFGGDMDGSNPQAGVVLLAEDALFGTTVSGGALGSGCVFRFDLEESAYSVLHHFGETDSDGQNPYAGLLLSGESTLYGTTSAGGSAGLGTIFRLETDGSGYGLLHHFSGRDGAFPYCPLVRGPDGFLYGTALGGGEMRGTIFKLKADGRSFRTVHRFESVEDDGANPFAGLILSKGVLYGTTKEGGANGNGMLFALNPRTPVRQRFTPWR